MSLFVKQLLKRGEFRATGPFLTINPDNQEQINNSKGYFNIKIYEQFVTNNLYL